MGRQFIAVVPDGPQDNHELNQLMNKLKRTTKDRDQEVRWVAPNLWHVTLQFLGDMGDKGEKLREFFMNMEVNASELILRLQGLGAFPTSEDARILWIGVQENQAFIDLQARIGEQLKAGGFQLGERDFRPHLTLGRFRNPMNASDLLKLGGRKHFGDYPIREIVLFESVLQANIIKYSPVLRRKL